MSNQHNWTGRQAYYLEYAAETLASQHPDANMPYEPYCGVAALFNGDLHAGMPQYASREEWLVVSPYIIRLVPEALGE